MVNFTDNLLRTWNINFQNSKALSSNLKVQNSIMNPCENWCYFLFCTKNFHFALFEVTIALFSKCVFSKLSTDGTLASNLSEKKGTLRVFAGLRKCGTRYLFSLFLWVKLDAAKNKHHYQLIWPVQNNMQKWSWLRDTIWNAQKIGICR